MKNFIVFGVHGKIRVSERGGGGVGGGFTKNQYIGGGRLPKKGACTVCRSKWGLARKRRLVFLRGV